MTRDEWKARYPRITERELDQYTCEHDYGDRCETVPFGRGHCMRTCQKCGQKMGLAGHCWELKEKREAAAAALKSGPGHE